ncbi:lysylphosphatidylglycerol synthase transmembrane domain-containing protein [Jannaschia seohaensis]|uniref:Uncharacterized membrane protein YbhN (UPF0104 family) n=1 Tax=Jannaschia seohaensis TaxID=475081 RepID=A0A2Y9A840_9RHOB|nr:lysylphosphatidylglycerol synthase transmembrane domain-containing protein [Jannaschia seohaensis]PWJ22441.1 uncharacterized membrane protein YbhN (UPF0104 family) [Jannaschia seohaensis]SSA38719.1 Uncharacterized membrane protein YbhN, UPF0104 family [Jannaschia seohaensis]
MTRARLSVALRVAAVVALAVLLWRVADGEAALARLAQAEPGWLLAAGALLALQTVLSAQRWRLTAAGLGLTLPFWTALREYYLAQVVNQSLPGGVLGDAGRAVRSRAGAGLRVAAQAVVFERLAGQLGLLALLCAGLALSVALPGLTWPDWLGLALLTGAGVATLVAAATAAAAPLRRAARAFGQTVFARGIWARQVGLSLGTALCNVGAFALCARGLGVPLPTLAVIAVLPLILFAMLLPLSIAGWGLREGAAALLFPAFGATAAEGLAASVAFGLVFLATSLPGLAIPLLRPNAPAGPEP